MTNTKARHQEILASAHKALKDAGGVETIDTLSQNERIRILRQMMMSVAASAHCARNIAKRNVAKAMRQARWDVQQDTWGGPRPNQTGRPPLPEDEKRQRVSTKLAPGSKELAQAIAEVLGLSGWGHAVDLALIRMVENDASLKTKLAKMGIIIKANDGKGL